MGEGNILIDRGVVAKILSCVDRLTGLVVVEIQPNLVAAQPLQLVIEGVRGL